MRTLLLISLLLAGCDSDTKSKTDVTPMSSDPPAIRNPVAEQLQKAQHMSACITASSLANAGEMAKLQTGACPRSVQQLADDRIISSVEPDPWGGAYTLSCQPSLVVRSPGPDNTPGTADDIVWGGEHPNCEGSTSQDPGTEVVQ